MTVHRACLTHKEPVEGCYYCNVLVGGVEMPKNTGDSCIHLRHAMMASNDMSRVCQSCKVEKLEAENKRLKDAAAILVEALEGLKRHKETEDGFYSCPRAENYFGRQEDKPIEERPCYCDYDLIEQAPSEYRKAVGESESEGKK